MTTRPWPGAGQLHSLWGAAGRGRGAAAEAGPAGGSGRGPRSPREPSGPPDHRAELLSGRWCGGATGQSPGANAAPPEPGVSCQSSVRACPDSSTFSRTFLSPKSPPSQVKIGWPGNFPGTDPHPQGLCLPCSVILRKQNSRLPEGECLGLGWNPRPTPLSPSPLPALQ